MRKSAYIFTLFCFMIGANVQAQFLINPSFEGEGLDNNAPENWYPCRDLCSPDNPPLPNIKVYLPASDGSRYLSLRTRGAIPWEPINEYVNDDVYTQLINPLVKGVNYKLIIDLANDTYVILWDSAIYTSPCRLRVWAGTNKCSKDELLGETGAVTDTTWKTYEFCFTPKDNTYNYFYLEADYVDNDTASGMLLVDNLSIIHNPDTTQNVVMDTIVMPGTTIDLNAMDGLGYTWNPQDNLSCSNCQDPSVTIWDNKIYDVRVVGLYNCFYNERYVINIPDCDEISKAKSQTVLDTTVIYGENITLKAGAGKDISWEPSEYLSCTGCSSPVCTPLSAINYVCTFTDNNGCDIAYLYNIEFKIKIPNVITPNADGFNDNFFIGGLPAGSFLKIVDRAGRLIYETKNYDNQWPGSHAGALIYKTDTYWYTLKCPGMEAQQGYILVKF